MEADLTTVGDFCRTSVGGFGLFVPGGYLFPEPVIVYFAVVVIGAGIFVDLASVVGDDFVLGIYAGLSSVVENYLGFVAASVDLSLVVEIGGVFFELGFLAHWSSC